MPCPNLSQLAQTCPNIPFLPLFPLFIKKMWIKKDLAWLSLALVISLGQCTSACWKFALESVKFPFILSGVCGPSEANYCSNHFEVLFSIYSVKKFDLEKKIIGRNWTRFYILPHSELLTHVFGGIVRFFSKDSIKPNSPHSWLLSEKCYNNKILHK